MTQCPGSGSRRGSVSSKGLNVCLMGSRVSAKMIEAKQFAAKHLGALLDETCQFEIVGTATHGETAMRLCRELSPEAVFLDINLPGKEGVSLGQPLKKISHTPRPR